MVAVRHFLGIGQSGDPLYGLLDSRDNYFYLVDYRLPVICQIAKILKTSRACQLVALSECTNYHHNIIDNDICAAWGVVPSPVETQSMIGADRRLVENTHSLDETSQIIMTNLQTARQIIELMHEIEESMDWDWRQSPKFAAQTFMLPDQWLMHAVDREMQYFVLWRKNWSTIKMHVSRCLEQTPLASRDFSQRFQQALAQALGDLDVKSMRMNLFYV